MSQHIDDIDHEIQLSHLLIDPRWASFPDWSHLDWLPWDQHIQVLKKLYGEQDTVQSFQCLENAATTNWGLLTTYPEQLFFQMCMRVVDCDPSPLLSAYLAEISSMSIPMTRYFVAPRPMTWDVPGGSLQNIIDVSSNLEGVISAVSVIPTTTRVVCGTEIGEMFIMDIESNDLVAQITGHSTYVQCITVSKDGALIASCSHDKTVRLWHAITFDQLCEPLTGHTRSVYCVAISDDCKYVASGSEDDTVRLWDVQRGCSIGNPLNGHSYSVTSVAFSANGVYLVSGSGDHSIRVWQIPFGEPLGTPFVGHNSYVDSICVSPDSRYILSASDDQTVRVWDFNSQQQLGEPLKFEDWVTYVSVSSDKHTVVSVCVNGVVNVWDMRDRKVRLQFTVDTKWYLNSSRVSVSFEKNFLVCRDHKTLFSYNLDQKITAPQPFIRSNLRDVTAVTSSDHSTVALCLRNHKKIYVWRVNSNNAHLTATPFGFKFKNNSVDLSSAGSLLLMRDRNWIHTWTLKGNRDCFGIPQNSGLTRRNQFTDGEKRTASTHSWKCVVSSRVKWAKNMIKNAKLDTSGNITVQRSDGMLKRCALKKKIRHSKWQFVELGDWAKVADKPIVPPWLVPFSE